MDKEQQDIETLERWLKLEAEADAQSLPPAVRDALNERRIDPDCHPDLVPWAEYALVREGRNRLRGWLCKEMAITQRKDQVMRLGWIAAAIGWSLALFLAGFVAEVSK